MATTPVVGWVGTTIVLRTGVVGVVSKGREGPVKTSAVALVRRRLLIAAWLVGRRESWLVKRVAR